MFRENVGGMRSVCPLGLNCQRRLNDKFGMSIFYSWFIGAGLLTKGQSSSGSAACPDAPLSYSTQSKYKLIKQISILEN